MGLFGTSLSLPPPFAAAAAAAAVGLLAAERDVCAASVVGETAAAILAPLDMGVPSASNETSSLITVPGDIAAAERVETAADAGKNPGESKDVGTLDELCAPLEPPLSVLAKTTGPLPPALGGGFAMCAAVAPLPVWLPGDIVDAASPTCGEDDDDDAWGRKGECPMSTPAPDLLALNVGEARTDGDKGVVGMLGETLPVRISATALPPPP